MRSPVFSRALFASLLLIASATVARASSPGPVEPLPTSGDFGEFGGISSVSGMLLSGSEKPRKSEGSSLSVGFGTVSYLYSEHPQKDSVFPAFNARGSGLERGPVFEAVGSAEALLMFAPGRSSWYFEAPEAYLSTRNSLGPIRFKLGRKLERWSRLDETWQLGIFQPRFRWDYIRPEQVGLTGAFLSVDRPNFRFTAFGTPFFIPERGVNISASNGSLSSQSPWFIPPPSRITLVDRATPVQYTLQLPELRDIVLHGAAAGMMRIGGADGAFVSAAYAYKPMNQLLLAYDGSLVHTDAGAPVAEATVHPRILYHHLASLDIGYTHRDFTGWISGLYDDPIRDVTSERWTTQEVTLARGFSSTLDLRVGGEPETPTRLEVSYLRVWGGNAPDAGAFAKGSGSVFDSRYPFQNALSVGIRGAFPTFTGSFVRKVSGSAKLITDFAHPGNVLSTELLIAPEERWTVAFGVDVLGSSSPIDSSTAGSDFIGRYRANDRIHAGVSYAF